MNTRTLSRRRLLLGGLGVAGAAALGQIGICQAAAAASTDTWTGEFSANGWPILAQARAKRIQGSNLRVAVAPGAAGTVLLHVARRFHYEISRLRPDAPAEITGHTDNRTVAQPYESNHLSGTAIAIRPGTYPLGVPDGFFPHELTVIRDILAECQGVVRWGGDEPTPKESHFQIDVAPGDHTLRALAKKINKWNRTPGAGAGATDPFTRDRLTAARAMAERQSRR